MELENRARPNDEGKLLSNGQILAGGVGLAGLGVAGAGIASVRSSSDRPNNRFKKSI